MISIAILILAAVLTITLAVLVHRSSYGSLRIDKLPVLFWALLAGQQQRRRLQRILATKPPAYSLIAAMEREVYGRTFKHDGTGKRSCCDTPLDGGHRGTCPHSLMNGGRFEEDQ